MSSLQDAWGNFQGGVKSVLNQWTALRLAVENNWGGGDSERKAALLEEELITLFRTKKEIYKDEVENFLSDFLDDNFSTYAEDDSAAEVGTMLVEMFAQCGRLDFTLANAVRAEEQRLFERKAAAPGGGTRPDAVSSSMSVKGEGEDDSSSDDDMEEDTEAKGSAGPDEDGWETVGSKKGGKGRKR